jgi:quinol monooxygenase YgiN
VIIVGGTFEVDPEQRDQFLTERLDAMRESRAEPGCLQYAFSADPLDAARVLLFERWETQSALDAHLNRLRSDPPAQHAVAARKASVVFYNAEVQPPAQPQGHGTAMAAGDEA